MENADIGPGGAPGGPGRVAVVGGGIAGLASAHFLAAAGASVTVFEASDQLGGLGTFFHYRDRHLERFYHCLLPGDDHLLGLLRDIGIADRVYWKATAFGFMRRGRLYGLNTPRELLGFDVLPIRDRLRLGLTGLWGRAVSSRGLDDITCVEWLTRLSGRRAFESFWKPMLRGKFGDRYHDVPALWFWTRFNREKGSNREEKGYIRGGYKHIVDRLASGLERRGHAVRLSAPVEAVDLDDRDRPTVRVPGRPPEVFDRLVYTAPLFHLRKVTSGGRLERVAASIDAGLEMQGVVNAVLMLRRSLTRFYWVAAIDDGVPFQGFVESTTLLDMQDTGGVHLVYLLNYVHRSEPHFARDDRDILEDYVGGLRRLFPDVRDDDVVDRFVFRTPFVEPLYTTGYLKRKPPLELVPGRVYLATSSQVYPEVTSWNGATGLARRAVDLLLDGARR